MSRGPYSRWPEHEAKDPIPFDRHRAHPQPLEAPRVDHLAPAAARMELAQRFWSRFWDEIFLMEDREGRIGFVSRQTGAAIKHPIGIKPELLMIVQQNEQSASKGLRWTAPIPTSGRLA